MVNQKFFTQDQVDLAKSTLNELPDLSPNKISRDEVLVSISNEIIILSTKKGYSAADIKSALETVNIHISEKAIQEVIRQGKTKSNRRVRPSQKAHKNTDNPI